MEGVSNESKSNEGKISDQIEKQKKEASYDSEKTDSGFLSGVNIQSETLASGEITPPKKTQEETPLSEPPTPQSAPQSVQPTRSEKEECKISNTTPMKLDSGVDVCLSGQLSDLYLEDQNDLDKPGHTLGSSKQHKKQDSDPWKLYFQQDEDGDTQLHIAIIQGSIEVSYNLIRMIPNSLYLDIRNDHTQTALHLAVRTSQSRIVRRLVCAGANTRIVDSCGNTPLHIATICRDSSCVKALTEPINPLEVTAAQLRYVPEHRQTHPPELNMNNYEGLTCIHIALLSQELNILKLLVGFGANIDAQEFKCGRTCLHLAAEVGDEKIARMLLQDLRADPEVPNYAGYTPYQIARRNKSFLRTLVASGAPEEDEYISSDDEDDDDPDMMAYDGGYRSNAVVNATA